jgi:ACS family hexuronate transporter-like MFS transporter
MDNKTLIGRYRWTICALLFFATTINYMDRQILGLLKPNLAQIFNWNEQDYGNIVVAFQAAYATGQVLFGPFIEWIGMKSAYAVAIVFWSIAAMAHPLAKSAFSFGAARFALGLGESGNFPAAIRTVAEWFPQRERSVATGLFNSGTNIGAIFAPVLVPWLTVQFGWKMAFVVLGVSGFAWLAFWLIFYDSPEKSRRLKADELAYIQSGRAESAEKVPWRKILVFKEAWAYIATGILVGPVWWFYLFWLPDFFSKQFHLDIKSFGLPLVVVYSVACLGSIGGGGLSAWFLRRGWSLNAARKTAALICACCTVPVIFATRTPYVWLAVSFFALATAAHQGWSATMYTVVSDIFPKKAVASVVGLAGMFASVAAMGFSWLVGHILQGTGVYDKILLICGLAYLAAIGIFHTIVPRIKPVEMI